MPTKLLETLVIKSSEIANVEDLIKITKDCLDGYVPMSIELNQTQLV